MKYNQVVKAVRELDRSRSDYPVVRVAFVGNITPDTLATYLKFQGHQNGMQVRVYQGGHDNAVQELMDFKSGLHLFEPEVIIVCLKLEGLSGALVNGFAALNQDQVQAEVERVLERLANIVSLARTNAAWTARTAAARARPWPG